MQCLDILADLPSLWLNGGTVPPDILTTGFRPDLVILNRSEKYNDLKVDLESAGWKVNLIPFEVGSRGQPTKRNMEALISVFKRNQIKVKHAQLFKDLSKIGETHPTSTPSLTRGMFRFSPYLGFQVIFTDIGFHLKSGFKKRLSTQTVAFILNLISRNIYLH